MLRYFFSDFSFHVLLQMIQVSSMDSSSKTLIACRPEFEPILATTLAIIVEWHLRQPQLPQALLRGPQSFTHVGGPTRKLGAAQVADIPADPAVHR